VPGRIVLLGATGFTGELVARALVARGAAPLLAGRDAGRVAELAAGLGGLDHATADARRPGEVASLLARGDVLVTLVGPYARLGAGPVSAAVARGAHYLDAAGEAPFLREVFARRGAEAYRAGCALVPAFGFDFVPGNLAGALALRGAGERVARVAVGYFAAGGAGAVSGGTRASVAGLLGERSHAWREGALVLEAPARRRRAFPVAGRQRLAVSVGGSEALALPRLAPLCEVTTFLGVPGRLPAAPLAALARAAGLLARAPGARAALARAVPGSRGGPGPEVRARSRWTVLAVAEAASGRQLAAAPLAGTSPYDLTAALLAWGATRAAAGGLRGAGALGPVDGFGLEALAEAVAAMGVSSGADSGGKALRSGQDG
jgi:short subunit dehydrogenase-like uncharacterized protein